jgi:hypothetical protein
MPTREDPEGSLPRRPLRPASRLGWGRGIPLQINRGIPLGWAGGAPPQLDLTSQVG